jgi:hypothetical protein
MARQSKRQIAKELDISPTCLSYMVNGKRQWSKNLYQRYIGVVNTFVNNEGPRDNGEKEGPFSRVADFTHRLVGGSARESNPPTTLVTRHNGFEVRSYSHQCVRIAPPTWQITPRLYQCLHPVG